MQDNGSNASARSLVESGLFALAGVLHSFGENGFKLQVAA
jgi:hypothetical protein